MTGIECNPISVELTCGLERLACLPKEKNVFDLNGITMEFYMRCILSVRKEFSKYNFELANIDNLFNV